MDFLQVRDYTPFNKWEQECISHLKNVVMTEDDTYTLLRIKPQKTLTGTINESDRVRFEWLKEHPDGCYIDPDCKLYERWVPPKDGKPYFASNSHGTADVFLIFVNGNTDYIKENFDQSLRQQYIEQNKSVLQDSFYGWPIDLCDSMKEYGIVPEHVYTHKYLSMKKEVKRRTGMQTVNLGEVILGINKKFHEIMEDIYNLESAIKDLHKQSNSNTDLELINKNIELEGRIEELEEELASK